MKNLISASLVLLVFLCACEKQVDSRVPIAILTPVSHPSLEQIEKGFVTTMEAANPDKYRFVTYNAQGNKTLMRSEIEEIVRQNYALVFTIGTTTSQMATECLMKKGMTTPIVFASVNDPVTFHIVQSEASSGTMATGVKELLNFNEELAALLRYKPQIKKIMLVYNPAEPGMAKDQQEIARLLKEKSITLTSVAVFQTNELLAKVTPFMAETDALIVLKDNTVVAGLDALVKLCNRHQVPLMASDLDSPDKGAAFGYGVYEIDFGIEGAKKALQVINEGVAPTDIPVTAVSKFTLRVNSAAAQKQGIDVSKIQQQEEGR